MSGYLLDTCTFLWLTLEPEKLSADAQDICEDPDNTLLLICQAIEHGFTLLTPDPKIAAYTAAVVW